MSNNVRALKRAAQRKQSKAGITVTLGQLRASIGSLAVLCSNPLPITLSFRLSKIIKAVDSEIDQFQTTTKEFTERYAEKDDDGKTIMLDDQGKVITEGQPARYSVKIQPDKMAEFNKEMEALTSTEVTIPGEQVTVEELGKIDIAPAHLGLLDWLVIEG